MRASASLDFDAFMAALQRQFGDGLVTVIGSGLSCAEGLPGMGALAIHLGSEIPKLVSGAEAAQWAELAVEVAAVGLEAALLRKPPSSALESAIVACSARFIAAAERQVVAAVFAGKQTLRLTRLLKHLLKPSGGIPIVTTNYDRLVEIAAEEAGLGADTLFVGGFAGALNETESSMSFCREVSLQGKIVRTRFQDRAVVLKPHGSLDWYHRAGKPVRYGGELPLPPLIITPGLNKFRNGYDSPFDRHRERANGAIDRAARFLILGYGFNDDHLETHLKAKIASGTPTLLLTFELSPNAIALAQAHGNVTAIDRAVIAGIEGSRVVRNREFYEVPGKKSLGSRILHFRGARTMTEAALQLREEDRIGRVASVDTSRVAVDVTNSVLLTRIGIGQLIAIQGTTEREFLIAMTERVNRSIREDLPPPEQLQEGEALLSVVPTDLLQAVLIGTYRTVDGTKTNTFKRGADSFPQIDRNCFVVEGANLQRFMGILGAGFDPNERLKLGVFVADHTAEAIASGDKFFQRHAAVLGSTGSGKSWSVALILERAARLKFPNIIVFDMHGEYTPLADRSNGGFADRFRIAGPGDLEKPDNDVLFLPYWLLNRDEMLSMILDRSDQNAPNQASRFTLHVRNLKGETLDRQSKAAVKKTFTVDSPIPYDMKKLIGLLNADNTAKGVGKNGPVKGEWEDKLTRFLSRMEAKVDDRRYGFMFAPPPAAQTYEWLAGQVIRLLRAGSGSGIKIIDFSEVPADILPVVTGPWRACSMTFSSGQQARPERP